MDISKQGWYCAMKIEGIAGEVKLEGSIVSMTAKLFSIISDSKARTSGSGAKSITIQFSDSPLIGPAMENLRLRQEVEAGIDMSLSSGVIDKREGESFLDMVERVMKEEGYNRRTADHFARLAFGYPPDADLEKWQNDSRVQMFNKMNASDKAASEAEPHTYAELKRYVQTSYPDFAANIKFRL